MYIFPIILIVFTYDLKAEMIHSSNFLKCLVAFVYDALMKIP